MLSNSDIIYLSKKKRMSQLIWLVHIQKFCLIIYTFKITEYLCYLIFYSIPRMIFLRKNPYILLISIYWETCISRYRRILNCIYIIVSCTQGHPVGLLGEDGGPTTGALSDGVQGIDSSEHHNPPEMLDGLDGKI